MNRRGFLKSVAVAVIAPTVLKGAVFPAAVVSKGVTLEQALELGLATLKDMPRREMWVNYYASYDYDMTEIYRGELYEKIRKETDKTKRCATEDSGIDRCDEVACNHLSVGQHRIQDAGRKAGVLGDCN